MTPADRAAFEAWANKYGLSTMRSSFPAPAGCVEDYSSREADSAWAAWQASAAHYEAEIAKLKAAVEAGKVLSAAVNAEDYDPMDVAAAVFAFNAAVEGV